MAFRLLRRINFKSVSRFNQVNLKNFNGTLFSTTQALPKEKKSIKITFVKSDGERIEVLGKVGQSLLDVVNDKQLSFEGYGACDGTLSCSTCHVILRKEDYEQIPMRTVEELDMLELTQEFSETSRLGCQVSLTEDMDGLVVHIPDVITDVRNSN